MNGFTLKKHEGSRPLQVWPLLETAAHPLTSHEQEVVRKGASDAKLYGQAFGDLSFIAILATSLENVKKFDRSYLSPLPFIGKTLGARAVLLNLDVDRTDSNGFNLSGGEVARFGEFKAIGTHVAEDRPEIPFEDRVAEILQIANRTPGNEDAQKSGFSEPIDFIAYAAGIHHFHLGAPQGVRV